MEIETASHTAQLVAYCRAYHATHDFPKIFDDFLAKPLLGDEVYAGFDQETLPSFQYIEAADPVFAASNPDQSAIIAWCMRRFMPLSLSVSRSQYTEDMLERAIEQGVKQYVILGAGLDTFAFRRADLLEKLQVFEIDHPIMQASKLRRLKEVGWEQPERLHYVPLDFSQANLAAAIADSSFYNPRELSFFSWLGVTYYLTRDAVFDTLMAIKSIASSGTKVVFDYLHNDIFIPEKTSQIMHNTLKYLQEHGEPWITGFDSSTLTGDLARIGFHLHENLSPYDIDERFFQGRTNNYHSYEHMHFALAAVV